MITAEALAENMYGEYAKKLYRALSLGAARRKLPSPTIKSWRELAPVTREGWIAAARAAVDTLTPPEPLPTCSEHAFNRDCKACITALHNRGGFSL